MINVELTEDQAKLLLILAGSCAGSLGSLGTYQLFKDKLSADVESIPDPMIKKFDSLGRKYETIVVTQEKLDSIVCD